MGHGGFEIGSLRVRSWVTAGVGLRQSYAPKVLPEDTLSVSEATMPELPSKQAQLPSPIPDKVSR